jgi:hypothetical protein
MNDINSYNLLHIRFPVEQESPVHFKFDTILFFGKPHFVLPISGNVIFAFLAIGLKCAKVRQIVCGFVCCMLYVVCCMLYVVCSFSLPHLFMEFHGITNITKSFTCVIFHLSQMPIKDR